MKMVAKTVANGCQNAENGLWLPSCHGNHAYTKSEYKLLYTQACFGFYLRSTVFLHWLPVATLATGLATPVEATQ